MPCAKEGLLPTYKYFRIFYIFSPKKIFYIYKKKVYVDIIIDKTMANSNIGFSRLIPKNWLYWQSF